MRAFFILLGVLAVGLSGQAYAQIPTCGEAASPACDGFCTTPGEACISLGGFCGCGPSGGAVCGTGAGPPLCGGDCPPLEACFSVAGVCECRGAGGFCGDGGLDPGESCDTGAANGSAGSCCNADCTLRSAGSVCRPVAGACDLAEACTGSSGACPPDGFQANGTSCDDGDVCTTEDQCLNGACVGNLESCGNGTVEPSCGEECDDGNTSDGDGCSSGCQMESAPVPILPPSGILLLALFLLGTSFWLLNSGQHPDAP